MRLETDRLVLRELTPEDASFILGLLNEPSFLRFIGDRGVRTEGDARAYLAKGPIASYARHGHGLMHVARKDSGAAIGMCGLVKRATLPDPDIGFAYLPAHWGQGFAFEAAAAVLAHGRDVLRLPRLLAIVSPDNERSKRLLVKLGLSYERTMAWPEGGDVDLFVVTFAAAPVPRA